MITSIRNSINFIKLQHRQFTLTCAALMLTSLCLLSFQARSTLINGDFESGDLSGWQQDNGVSFNDGFSVVNNGRSQVAQIQALAEDGANGFTLFQDVSATANTDGQFNLSFDWFFSGMDTGEFFVVHLFNGTDYFAADGSFGELFFSDIHGSGSVNLLLDFARLPTSPMWSLEFQLNTGFDFFDDSALLQIDNVQLMANVVPEPANYLVVLLALYVLCYFSTQKHKTNRQISKRSTHRIPVRFATVGY